MDTQATAAWTRSSTFDAVEYAFVLAWMLFWAVPGMSVLITGIVLLARRRHRLPARTVRLGQAGLLVLAVTSLVGVATQVATVYVWTRESSGPDRTTAVSLVNMLSGLVVTVGDVVGMALVVAALLARATPDPFGVPAGS
jgi:hypothetical protein